MKIIIEGKDGTSYLLEAPGFSIDRLEQLPPPKQEPEAHVPSPVEEQARAAAEQQQDEIQAVAATTPQQPAPAFDPVVAAQQAEQTLSEANPLTVVQGHQRPMDPQEEKLRIEHNQHKAANPMATFPSCVYCRQEAGLA